MRHQREMAPNSFCQLIKGFGNKTHIELHNWFFRLNFGFDYTGKENHIIAIIQDGFQFFTVYPILSSYFSYAIVFVNVLWLMVNL